MNLKKAIRIAMATKEMEQKDIAAASGITPGHLSTVVNGKHSATIPTVQKIADALDMKLSELIALGED